MAYRHSVYSALPSAQAFCGDLVISPISHRRFMHFAQRHARARTSHAPTLPPSPAHPPSFPAASARGSVAAGATRAEIDVTPMRNSRNRDDVSERGRSFALCDPRGSSSVDHRKSQVLVQKRVMPRRAQQAEVGSGWNVFRVFFFFLPSFLARFAWSCSAVCLRRQFQLAHQ